MSANTILTSVLNGGSNSHATVSEEANSLATDFVTQGVVGAITLNTGSGGTGSFCVNANASPDMGVTIKSGQAYITATPSSQNSQVLRARASTDYTTYTINANASGSTKYDWIYLSVSATNANNPDAAADNVTSLVTSRSTSNSSDTGSPPTYGLLLAIVTVANGASSITNSNITDRRFNTSIGAQNGSLIVTQASTGTNAIIQAAGIDANVNLALTPKGTGYVKLPTGYPIQIVTTSVSATATGNTLIPNDDTIPQSTEGDQYMSLAITPHSATSTLLIDCLIDAAASVANDIIGAVFQDSNANAIIAGEIYQVTVNGGVMLRLTGSITSGTTSATTIKVRVGGSSAGTITFNGAAGGRRFGTTPKSSLTITEIAP